MPKSRLYQSKNAAEQDARPNNHGRRVWRLCRFLAHGGACALVENTLPARAKSLTSGRQASLHATCVGTPKPYSLPVTDKQAVIDALNRLPEVASLEEITDELHIMASIRRGRADIAAGRSKSHEEVEQLVDSWATSWTSR